MAIRKIVSRSIGTDVIAAEDLAANSVTVAEIQDGAVTTNKIGDGAVTAGKIDSGVKLGSEVADYTSDTFSGDGSTTTFTITTGHSVNSIMVVYNGFILTPTTDYTVSGTTLTMGTAPTSGAELVVRYFPI